MSLTALHPLPPDTDGDGDPGSERWGYDHAIDGYSKADPHWQAVTAGTVEGALLRLVSGWSPRKRTFSRHPDDWISLDTYSIGIAHWWAETADDLLAAIYDADPDLAVWAWGEDGADLIGPLGDLEEWTGVKRRKTDYDDRFDWLLAGWYAISRHPTALRVQCAHWLDRYAAPALADCKRWGWTSARSLAAVARMRNSGKQRHIDRVRNAHPGWDEARTCQVAMGPGYYGHADRWDAILAMPELHAPLPATLDASRLALDVLPVRIDGTVPTWPEPVPTQDPGEATYARAVAVIHAAQAECILPPWEYLTPAERARVAAMGDT